MLEHLFFLKRLKNVFITLLIILLFSPNLFAQTGKITGKVIDSSSESPLPGANIILENTNMGATTNTDGVFIINRVKPNNYKITVSYLGYQKESKDIQVQANRTTEVNFALKGTSTKINEVTVYGELSRGQAISLNDQKNAPNIKNVISAEQFSRFPDKNVAEALQRVPSVSITTDQGEGEMIQIRGVPQEYNSITLDGVRIPSPDPDANRAVGLDLIQANLMETITVTKALTPDMCGDAIGGSVDFKVKDAPEIPFAKFVLSGGYNNQRSEYQTYGKNIMNFSGIGGKRFFNNKLGLILAASYYFTNRGSILQEYNYENDNTIIMEMSKWSDYDVQRQRYGFNFVTDYKFDLQNKIKLTASWNRYLDDEIRRKVQYEIADKEEYRETRNRREDQKLATLQLMGDHTFNSFDLDYKGFYIETEELMPDRTYWKYYRDNPYTGWTNDQFFTITGKETFDNLGLDSLELKKARYDNNKNDDKNYGGLADLKFNFNLLRNRSYVKGGVFVSQKNRSYRRTRFNSKTNSPRPTIPGGVYGLVNIRYDDPIVSELNLKPWKEDEGRRDGDYDAGELIMAAYAMADLGFTNKFSVLLGARFENTQNDYTQIVSGNESTSSYSNFLPSAHFTYRFNENSNLRLALTTGLSRPAYHAMVPYDFVNEEDKKISRGNPNLKALTSSGIDLLYELYTNRLGLLSAGFFAKSIKDQLTRQTTYEMINGEKYEVTQPINGDNAEIYGFEIAFNQRFYFINSVFFQPFGIYANYTFTHSTQTVKDREMPLSSSPRHIANLSLFYDNPHIGLQFTIATIYRSALIKSIGTNERNDIWYNDEFHLDISLQQKIMDHLSILLQANNLTDQEEVEMLGDPTEDITREHQIEGYGAYFRAGVRIDF